MSWRSCKVCQDRLNPRSAVGRKWACALIHVLSTSMQKFRPVGGVWACTPPWLALAFPDAISARGGGNIEACGGRIPRFGGASACLRAVQVTRPSTAKHPSSDCVGPCREVAGTSREDRRTSVAQQRRIGEQGISDLYYADARRTILEDPIQRIPKIFRGHMADSLVEHSSFGFCIANQNSVSNCIYCDFFADWWCWPSLAPLVSRAAADNLCLH